MFGKRADPQIYSPKQKLVENDPNWTVLLQIWFALTWRYFLWSFAFIIPSFIALFLFLMLCVFGFGMGKDTASTLGGVLGFICTFVSSLMSFFKGFKGILSLRFFGYQLVLLTPDLASEAEKSDL